MSPTPPQPPSANNAFDPATSNCSDDMPELEIPHDPPSETDSQSSHGVSTEGTSSGPPTDNGPQAPPSAIATTTVPHPNEQVMTAQNNTGYGSVSFVQGAGGFQPLTPQSQPVAPGAFMITLGSGTIAQVTSQAYVSVGATPPSDNGTPGDGSDSQPVISMSDVLDQVFANWGPEEGGAPPSVLLNELMGADVLPPGPSDEELTEPVMPSSDQLGALLANLISAVPPGLEAAVASLSPEAMHASTPAITQQFQNLVMNGGTSSNGTAIPPLPSVLWPLGFPQGMGMGATWGSNPVTQSHFDAVAFVNSLEEVDISTIPAEDMRCPHCWLPFGTTDEDDPSFNPDFGDDVEVASHLMAFRELPSCESKPDNTPVKTPCGHIFGKTCLIESLEKTSTTCPICRHEFRSHS